MTAFLHSSDGDDRHDDDFRNLKPRRIRKKLNWNSQLPTVHDLDLNGRTNEPLLIGLHFHENRFLPSSIDCRLPRK